VTNVKQNRRGIALILVVVVIALTSVMGYAMLSSSMLQKSVYGNAGRAAAADGLAESGVNLAMYYLTHPNSIPGGGTYWAGTGGADVALGSLTGTINVAVTTAGTDGRTYEIVSIGKSGGTDSVSRTLRCRVQSNKYVVRHGALFNTIVTLPYNAIIEGDVATNGRLNLSTLGLVSTVVNGSGFATLYTANPKPRDGFKPFYATPVLAPATSDVNTYHTYRYNGVTYSAEQLLVASLVGVQGVVTKTVSPGSNPLGVFYVIGNTALLDNVTIEGTLIVEGNLTIQGNNITITPREGMPALIVTGYMEVQQPIGVAPRTITLNGVTYIGNQLRGTGAAYSPINTTLNINGALIVPGGTPFNA
jgi:hypothetical protein